MLAHYKKPVYFGATAAPQQSQPPVPMQIPNVPLVPYGYPVVGSMAPETIAVRPPPTIISPPVGVAPRLPSWIVIMGLVTILAIIAEVDSMSKDAGMISTPYGGPVLQNVIGLATLAGGVGLLFFISYCPSIEQFLIAALWRQNLVLDSDLPRLAPDCLFSALVAPFVQIYRILNQR